jgi:hypothetical protein
LKLSQLLATALFLASSANASIIGWTATLSGSAEIPSNASTGTGFVSVTVDTVANTLAVGLTFSGLTGGNAAAAHIHCCTPQPGNTGVALPFTGFPGATSGSYSNIFDLTQTATYQGTFLTGNGGTAASAEAALIAGLLTGQTYANIHNQTFPGGEIRGVLVENPEPGTFTLAFLALAVVVAGRRQFVHSR